ncbi:MAG TPA: MutH/Sau3AI family endonuclease, partial [Polyangiaceae bacterium]|nr:MutH/Sau3AI family endonuclease [Polyangiaceae bacterium]
MSPTRPPTATSRPATPRSEAELRARAEALAGHDLGALADALGVVIPGDPRRTKGKWGELLERALGATAGSRSEPDFPHLGVELKTVPMRADGRAIESTYVCRIDLARAEELEGETSAARRKLMVRATSTNSAM